jgi:alpha-tubulin suppressor-like RCC1 family protein
MPISFNKLVLGGGAGGGMSVGKLPIDLTTPTPSPTATEAPTPTPTASPAPTPNPTTTAGVVSGLSLWSWGGNTNGLLGINSVTHRSSPVIVVYSGDWNEIFDTGMSGHTAAIKSDGSLYMWGSNVYGEIGINDTIHRSSPVQVASSVTSWKMASCGSNFTVAIDDNNALWSWGFNATGFLGTNDTINRSSPVMISSDNWIHVTAGGRSAAAIKNDNSLWVWGSGSNLGLNSVTISYSSPTQIAGSYSYVFFGFQSTASNQSSIFIKTDGSMWTCGNNSNGLLGDGTTVHRSSPVQYGSGYNWISGIVSNGVTIGHRQDLTLWFSGSNTVGQFGRNNVVLASSPVQEITSSKWRDYTIGNSNVSAIKLDNTLWSWGYNINGNIGDNTKVHRSSPVQIASGNSYSWKKVGGNSAAVMSLRAFPAETPYASPTPTPNPTSTPTFTPTVTPSPTPDASFPAGNSLAYITNDRVASKQPIMYSLSGSMSKLDGPSNDEGTSNNSFFIIDNGYFNAYGFGTNDRGQLGDLSVVNRPASSPSQVVFGSWKQISVGSARTVAGIQNAAGSGMPQKLYVWGSGGSALAQGSANFQSGNRSSPIFTCMGDDESWAKVVMGSWSPGTNGAIQDSTGNGSGTLWMWGGNYYGSLGVDDTVHRSSQIQVMTGGTWLDLAIGSGHVLAVKDNGSLWSWGKNTNGQLGHNTAIGVAQSGCSSPVQIGIDTDWYQVFAGENVSFATKSDGRLFAWGSNAYGVLGINNTVHRSSPVQVGTTTNWSKIALAGFITYGLKTDGSLWSWGGQSHDGSTYTNTLSSPVQVAGLTNNGKYIDITTRGRITGSTIETYALWDQLN